MRNARLGGCAAALMRGRAGGGDRRLIRRTERPHDRGADARVRPADRARVEVRAGGRGPAAGPGRAHAAERLGARGPRRSAPLALLLRAADRLPARRRGVARTGGVRRQGREQRVSPAGGVPPVGDRLQLPPAEPVHGREPARAGRRSARADGPRRSDRRPRRQPAAQRGRVGPAADRGRHAAHAQQRHQERLLRVPAGGPGRAAGARDGRARSRTSRPTWASRTTTTSASRRPTTTTPTSPSATSTAPSRPGRV